MSNFSSLNYDEDLKLSPKNPAFYRDFIYMVEELDKALSSGEIDREAYDKLYAALYLKKDGMGTTLTMNSFFSWFSKIKVVGYVNLHFTKEEFETLITSRAAAQDFLNWVSPPNHRRDNPALMKYLEDLTASAIAAYKANSQEFWDIYYQLKWDVVRCLARGILSRSKITSITDLLKFFMDRELREIKAIPSRDVHELAFFSKPAKEIGVDIDTEVTELFKTFVTDGEKYFHDSREAMARLRRDLESRNISVPETNMQVAKLDEAILGIANQDNIPAYYPIIEFYFAKEKGKDLRVCYTFSESQIVNAALVAKNLVSVLTNEYLIHEMVYKKLNTDLAAFYGAKDVKDMLYSTLLHDLELLKDHDLISLTDYVDFINRGKEKFT